MSCLAALSWASAQSAGSPEGKLLLIAMAMQSGMTTAIGTTPNARLLAVTELDDAVPMEVDHVIPRCQGGSDELDNLATSCLPCNREKAGRTPEEWQGAIGSVAT